MQKDVYIFQYLYEIKEEQHSDFFVCTLYEAWIVARVFSKINGMEY